MVSGGTGDPLACIGGSKEYPGKDSQTFFEISTGFPNILWYRMLSSRVGTCFYGESFSRPRVTVNKKHFWSPFLDPFLTIILISQSNLWKKMMVSSANVGAISSGKLGPLQFWGQVVFFFVHLKRNFEKSHFRKRPKPFQDLFFNTFAELISFILNECLMKSKHFLFARQRNKETLGNQTILAAKFIIPFDIKHQRNHITEGWKTCFDEINEVSRIQCPLQFLHSARSSEYFDWSIEF